MAKPLRVLIVEDSEDDALLLVNALKDGGYEPIFERVDTSEGFKSALSQKKWDCILSDYSMPQFNGLAALREIQEHGVDIPFILVSGTIGEDTAAGAMKSGAHDYIMKGKLKRLVPAVERELADAEVRRRRRQAEEWLCESEDRYRDLVQHSSDLVCTHDLEGKILSVNPAATRFSGYSEDELLSMNLRDLLDPEVRDQFENYLVEIQAKGAAKGSMLVQSKSGERRLWEYNNSLRTRDDAVAIVRGTARDITERKLAEEALLRKTNELSDFIEHASVGMHWVGPDGTILWVNQAELNIVGYTREEYIGHNIAEFHVGQSLVQQMMERLNRGETLHDFDVRLRRKDGSIRHVLLNSSAFYEDGKLIHFRCFTHDITERREAEQMLRQAQKVEAIGQLAGGVAHDFNNIMMAITGYCELLLLKTAPTDPLQAFVLEMQKAANRGTSLTRQLLAFSRKQILEPKVLNLNDVIKNMEGMLRRLVRENIELKLSLNEGLGHVKADPGQFEQVIMNLAINASDAMPTGGTLKIETSNVTFNQSFEMDTAIIQPGNHIMISVKDSGTGMDEAVRAHIFEPFFTTKEQGKGTGLGLATVYGIVKQTEGYIFVESAPGHGTTFTIYLPRWEGQEEPAVTTGAVRAVGLPKGSGSILLVDDNDSVRTAVAAFLEISGYRVLQAANGRQALDVSRGYSDGIDLVITDVVMPQMGGAEFVKQLVAKRPGINVIYMSGYSEEAAALQSNLHPNSAYLQKPVPMQTLLQTICDLLGR